MREYKGYQLRQTHEQFEKLLQEAGIEASGLEVKNAGSSQHSIILDGKLIGFYRYTSGRLKTLSGCRYDWDKELLIKPGECSLHITFAEVLRLLVTNK